MCVIPTVRTTKVRVVEVAVVLFYWLRSNLSDIFVSSSDQKNNEKKKERKRQAQIVEGYTYSTYIRNHACGGIY